MSGPDPSGVPDPADLAAPAGRVAVVLAAGKGTRMRSERPKVLHEAAGRPLLAWVLDAARGAGCERILVVVGHRSEEVRRAFEGADDVTWVLQERQRGTGHALLQVADEVRPGPSGASGGRDPASDRAPLLLVLSGDAPLVRPETLDRLTAAVTDPAGGAWGAMAVSTLDEPGSLGRVIPRDPPERDAGDGHRLARIVEASDATPEELAVRTVNAGMYALPAGIFPYLERLEPDNVKGELYLTDALVSAAADGEIVRLVDLEDPTEALGVNTPTELEDAARVLAVRAARAARAARE
ncbi:MAG: NTP transferase domain-containing protein [Acidobacteriota bacterium]|jgi:bifunctional N-acetylglucosamine-1-phosphate-uridyltransferase/glucosamine-1-phosphate-acetyltransferase GlmU-like protein